MPPPTTSRMTKNPVKPARYRPGKAVAAEASSSSSEEEDNQEEDQETKATNRSSAQPRAPAPKATSFPSDAKKVTTNLKNVDLNERRRQREAQERDRRAQEQAETDRMAREAGFVTESEEESGSESGSDEDDEERPTRRAAALKSQRKSAESEDEDEDSEEDDSSEENSDSSSDAAPRKMLRPVFLKKNQRDQTVNTRRSPSPTTKEAEAAARRQAEADSLIQAEIDRKIALRATANRDWDADDTGVAQEEMIDDTDGLDPELEQSLWVARELSRLKRDRAALEEREAEIAEVERRRALSSAEREAEDKEYIDKQRQEREDRGKMAHMQRYHHKGAFYNDEGEASGLANRDLMGARFVDQTDISVLPQYLQRRDQTKIGKKGATRYRDMKTEDTGRFGDFVGGRKGPRDGGFGGDDRFRPDEPQGFRSGTGANASAVGEKRGPDREGRGQEPKRPKLDT